MIRTPAVAGQFYPGSRAELSKMLGSFTISPGGKIDALGAVSPHAGYIYSGKIAADLFCRVKPKSTYIVLGPNHTGIGETFGIDPSDFWHTPMGEVPLDQTLAESVVRNSDSVKFDRISGSHEHSIEVQLPFIQFFLGEKFKLVPIVVSHSEDSVYGEIGSAIAKSVTDLKMLKDVMIISSSDMTHYEPQGLAESKDNAAIEAILSLDPSMLSERVRSLDISMCGFAPTLIMLAAVKELGARHAKLVRYQTSGDVTGDFSSVVGYAGIVID
jgi:AmmeMemoRadiSam system protein B